jgi:hypothetical protein
MSWGILADKRAGRLRAEREFAQKRVQRGPFWKRRDSSAGTFGSHWLGGMGSWPGGAAEEAGLWIREIWEVIEKQRYVSDVSQAQLIFGCFVGADDQEKWQQSRRMQSSLTVYTLGEVQYGRESTPGMRHPKSENGHGVSELPYHTHAAKVRALSSPPKLVPALQPAKPT